MTEIIHTHNKTAYGVVIGRKLYKYVRPALTKQKRYREPVFVGIKWFKSGIEADLARERWEQNILV